MPKSRRSVRDLPMPAELTGTLQQMKTRQQEEAMTFGIPWSKDCMIAVREDGSPIRHEWYSDGLRRLRERAGRSSHLPERSTQHQPELDARQRFASPHRRRVARTRSGSLAVDLFRRPPRRPPRRRRHTCRVVADPPDPSWDTAAPPPSNLPASKNQKTRSDTGQSGFFLVGLTGFEPATT